jgi:PcfJ-like protein
MSHVRLHLCKKMGRRPKIWDIKTRRCRAWQPCSQFLKPHEIAALDVEKWDEFPHRATNKNGLYSYGRNDATINRFLMENIGRDYNEVYADLVKRISKRHRHIVNLGQYRLPCTHHSEVNRWYLDDYRHIPQGFYVDLATRVLCFHERLGRHKIAEEIKVKPVYKPFSITQFKMTRNDYGQKYVFNQLLTYEDFEVEAERMRHCIRTYWQRCTFYNQEVSIWSFTCGNAKVMTIEVNKGEIYQVRGHLNRKANENERLIIQSWAKWLQLGIREFAF